MFEYVTVERRHRFVKQQNSFVECELNKHYMYLHCAMYTCLINSELVVTMKSTKTSTRHRVNP